MPLADYQDLVGTAAGVVTIAQFFSPIFICKQIIGQGNTKNVDSTPFVGGIGMGLLMLRHGYLLEDPTMTVVNVAALILNSVYLFIFFTYTNDKGSLVKNFLKTVAGSALIISYTVLDWSPNRVLAVYGSIVTLVMLILVGAPLRDLKEIIKTKNTGSMPFPMIVSGEVVLSLWLLYGIIINNIFIIIQNAVALTLTTFQLALFFIYPSKKTSRFAD